MQRYSKKREAIYQCLCSTDRHPTAEWIFRQLQPEYPDLSLATVYRNLTALREAGQIRSVGVVDGQERFDAKLSPHGHLVCRQCGTVEDFPEAVVPAEMLQHAERVSGWSVTDTSLRIVGLCPLCRNAIS